MSQTYSGFVYDDAGAPVASATVLLLDRNTTTPTRASTTTNGSGFWTITHATEGQFDVQITSGSSVRRIKYDDAVQLQELEANVLRLRGSDDAFSIVFVATPSAQRTWTVPDSSDTFVGKATTDVLTNKTLTSPVLNGTLSGTAFLDEDDLSSDSAIAAASQQSIKAYVDTRVPSPVEAKNSSGSAASEAVTWTTAFASTPVVVVSCVGSTDYVATVTARSTTGATANSQQAGVNVNAVKMFIATLPT